MQSRSSRNLKMNYIYAILSVSLVTVVSQTTVKTSSSSAISDCRGKAADVMFALDASNSIWREDFKRQLAFVSNVVDLFTIGSRNQKVSVVTYSNNPRLQFPFYAYDVKSDLKAAISAIRQDGGLETMTHRALEFLRKYAFQEEYGARRHHWVNRIGIVVTDGNSRNATATREEAMKVREKGIHLFAIGVGSHVNDEELEMIASKPTEYYVFRVSDFQHIDTIKDFLAIKTCVATNPTTTKRTTTTTTTTTTRPTTTTTTTTTTKPTTTTTTTTRKPSTKRTRKPTSARNKFQHPGESMDSQGLTGISTKLDNEGNSKDSLHLGVNDTGKQPHFNPNTYDERRPSNSRDHGLSKTNDFNEDSHAGDEGIGEGKTNPNVEGSGYVVDRVAMSPTVRFEEDPESPNTPGSIPAEGDEFMEGNSKHSLVSPPTGVHLDAKDRHPPYNPSSNPGDWNIATDNQPDPTHKPNENSDQDPYNFLSNRHDSINPDKSPRTTDCENVDFWGLDDKDNSVYYQVVRHAPLYHSGHRRYLYRIISVHPKTKLHYYRNLRRDFWGYDDHNRPIGMRFYEPRTDSSLEADRTASWYGPLYEMLSGPCLPILSTSTKSHDNDVWRNTNGVYVTVLEDKSGGDSVKEHKHHSSRKHKTDGHNQKFVFSLTPKSQNTQILDKSGMTGFWDSPKDPEERQVWYQFVCPGVYVEADNETGIPLNPAGIPSRVDRSPPPHGHSDRGCWMKRKRSPRGQTVNVPGSNQHSHHGGNPWISGSNLEGYSGRTRDGNEKDSKDRHDSDDEFEIVWVEYTGPGRFDPIGEKPKVIFETSEKTHHTALIPHEEDDQLEMSGKKSTVANNFAGIPRMWSVQIDGSMQCMNPDAGTPRRGGGDNDNHQDSNPQSTVTNEITDSSFKPETVYTFNGLIYAELTNGSRAPIGCIIGTTYMIGHWANENEISNVIGSSIPANNDQRYFVGYPVNAGSVTRGSLNRSGAGAQTFSWNDPANKVAWKPSVPIKLSACKPIRPLDLVVGIDFRSRSGKKRRRIWQIIKDFMSGLDMRSKTVSVRFAHDYIDLDSHRSAHYHTLDNNLPSAEHQDRVPRFAAKWKRSGVFTDKKQLLRKLDQVESMFGTAALLRSMADMLQVDGFALSDEELTGDACGKNRTKEMFSSKDKHLLSPRRRRDVRKIGMLIVDGEIEDIKESRQVADELKQRRDFELFTVGIGKNADIVQLMSMAGSNGGCLNYFDFDSLKYDQESLDLMQRFFLHKDTSSARTEEQRKPKKHKGNYNQKQQYLDSLTKLLTRLCENR